MKPNILINLHMNLMIYEQLLMIYDASCFLLHVSSQGEVSCDLIGGQQAASRDQSEDG